MGIRTPDLLHAMQALYQLSYSPSTREPGNLVAGPSATPVYKKRALACPARRAASAHVNGDRPEHAGRAAAQQP
jgi:hypothetical protein